MSRKNCGRCARPSSHCLCAWIRPQTTQISLQILQHSDETSHPFTTARLAALGASSVALYTGIFFPAAYFDTGNERATFLLYSDHNYGSRDKQQDIRLALDGIPTAHNNQVRVLQSARIIVLDGTWRNTRELILNNTWLAQHPVISLTGFADSRYDLRKSNQSGGVSTIEAIAALLAVVEQGFDVAAYLHPLERMLQLQRRYH